MIIHVARHTARVCMTLIGIVLIVVAVFTASARIGLPLLANYKGVVESRLGDYFRSPVDIGQLSLSWEGMGPLLRAEDVTVLETPERKVSLDTLLIDVNLAKSLLRGIPVINELTLVGASLAIEADNEGKLRLHGMKPVGNNAALLQGAAQPSESDIEKKGRGIDIVAWLLNARRIGLLDTQISLIGLSEGAPLVIHDLNIWAENKDGNHQLQLELTLPEELGGFVEGGYNLTGSANSPANFNGEAHLRTNGLGVKALSDVFGRGHLPALWGLPPSPVDTHVSFDLWAGVQDGEVFSVVGPVSSDAVYDVKQGDLLLSGISAMLDITLSQRTKALVLHDAFFQSENGESHLQKFVLSWRQELAIEPSDGIVEAKGSSLVLNSVEANGSKLELGALAVIATRFLSKNQPALSQSIRQAEVQGWARDWVFTQEKQYGEWVHSLSANLDRLQFSAVENLPGLGPVNGHVVFENRQGKLALSSDHMALLWPAYSERALQLDTLKAAVTLDFRNRRQTRLGADVALQSGGIDLSTRVEATLVPDASPLLYVKSQYSVADVTELKQWLPRQLIGPGLSNWLDEGIESGALENGSLLFHGNVSDFPFRDKQGVFQARLGIREGQLRFLPDWPAARHINGVLELDGVSLVARTEHATLDRFDLSQTVARIDDLLAPVLKLQGTGRGKLQEIVNFANTGPLSSLLEPVLSDVTANGNADLDLTLSAQLYRDPQSAEGASEQDAFPLTVDGAIFLQGNRINFGRADMTVDQVRGSIGFDHQGVRVNNLRARALDHTIVVNAQTNGQGDAATTKVSISGALKGSDALAHYGSQLDQFLRGVSSWKVELSAPHSAARMKTEGLGMRVTSDLVGTQLILPRPLNKGSALAADFELNTAFRDAQATQEWDIKYANKLHVNASTREDDLESLLIHMGSGDLAPALIQNRAVGIQFEGEAGTVALDGWVETLADFLDSMPDSEGNTPIMPIVAQLDIDSLQLGERVLGAASMQVNTGETYLNFRLKNPSITGNVQFPREHWSKTIPMKVLIDHLDSTLIVALSSGEEALDPLSRSSDLDPRLLPPLEARVGRLTHKDYTLRDVVLRAEPDVSGLTVSTLGFAYQTMRLVGKGYWRMRDPQEVNPALMGQQMSYLNLELQGDNFGEALASIGVDDALSDGEGFIKAQLSWPGPLYAPELSALDGQVKLLIERGNIIPLEPGAGRIVGLFALQALPRRLEFDFKDFTAEGLAFQSIAGDITIEDGVADAALVQLTGPIGVVDISGKSNLNTSELDQIITILPRVSAALPIIGLASAGATGGIGALVATGLLKAVGLDLDRIGLRNYRLTGKWDDPLFQPLESDYRYRK